MRKEAENLLAHCHSFEAILTDHTEVGHLKVGASFTIGNHLATRYLAGYLSKYPEADVQLAIANTPDVVARVLNFDVDIGMIEGEVHHRELELIPWREDELVVFCAADHPLARKRSLTNKDIREALWILREPDSGARQTFDRALAGLLPSINIYLELKHNEAIKNAVESGLGMVACRKLCCKKISPTAILYRLPSPAGICVEPFTSPCHESAFILNPLHNGCARAWRWIGSMYATTPLCNSSRQSYTTM